jgi:hypothetical protein
MQLTDILLLLSERAPQPPSTELPPTTSSKHEGLSREEREKKISDALKKNVGLTFMMIASTTAHLINRCLRGQKSPANRPTRRRIYHTGSQTVRMLRIWNVINASSACNHLRKVKWLLNRSEKTVTTCFTKLVSKLG